MKKVKKLMKLLEIMADRTAKAYTEGYEDGRRDAYKDTLTAIEKYVERERVIRGK